jgi:RimJ/RimL family protein N-acetyltransferase
MVSERRGLGRVYATEMAREALELDDLASVTTPANVASQAVIRKLGFRYESDIEYAGLPHVLFGVCAGDRGLG